MYKTKGISKDADIDIFNSFKDFHVKRVAVIIICPKNLLTLLPLEQSCNK